MGDVYCQESKKPLIAAEDSQSTADNYASINRNTGLPEEYKEKLYARRWYILFLFSVVSATQAAVWNTMGPITDSAKIVFHWEESFLALFPAIGNVAYLTVLFAAWVMDVKGMRVAMVGSTSLLFLGTLVRCFTSQPLAATWLILAGAVLNGVAGTVPFGGPPLLSALWFPAHQRATATAISTVFNYLGMAFSFIIGPQLVTQPPDPKSCNHTMSNGSLYMNNTVVCHMNGSSIVWDPAFVQRESREILRLMYIECGFAGLLFLLVVIYFPSKPPTPPSVSASKGRMDFTKGVHRLIRMKQFWLILVAYGVPVGVFGVWGTVMNINLNPIGVGQDEAAWIGFYATLAGCVAGLVLSRIADIFSGHLKLILIIFYTGAVLSVVWYTILWLQLIPFNAASLYISSIMIGVCINGTVPLFYEMACETCYPVAEGITGSVLTLFNNTIGIMFLALLQIPSIGAAWMNWTLLGSCVLSLPSLALTSSVYGRLTLDTHNEDTDNTQSPDKERQK